MSNSKILELAKEITEARDIEIPEKLLKLRDIIQKDDNPKKLKFDIYKYNILEAISVEIKNEYGYLKDGWNIAVELTKTFNLCTNDFSSNDKQYQNVFLPNASENFLILAKKLQDKYIKAKVYSDEFLNLFRVLMKEYTKLATNNTFIALKCLKSQRLFQLLLSDEQNTSAIVINAVKELIKIKRNLFTQLDEKTVYLYLDELVYKMATTDLDDVGIAIFQLIITMCQMDPNLIKHIIRRYKGMKLLLKKWEHKKCNEEVKEFGQLWEGAYKTKQTDQDIDNKAIIIQKTWRGYMERKRLKKANQAFSNFQHKYRVKKQKEQEDKEKRLAEDELKFQLLLEHRRRQRQRKLEMVELLEILPANQIEKYLEKQREYSAVMIQSYFRGYRQRKVFNQVKDNAIRTRAAVCIQRTVRAWIERMHKRRQQPAFYSRPAGLTAERREHLFDHIRKHLDSLPPHPRNEKTAQEMHEKAQSMFHEYVLNQRKMRQQQQNVQLLFAFSNNDADLILNAPKLSQITEDDVNHYFSHKSRPVILAAKEAHKKMLKKHNTKWYQALDTDSEDELDYDESVDELSNNIRNLNFNSSTDNYYNDNKLKSAIKRNYMSTPDTLQIHKGITKKEKNTLRTSELRKNLSKMMNIDPSKLSIWNVDPFDSTLPPHIKKLIDNNKNNPELPH